MQKIVFIFFLLIVSLSCTKDMSFSLQEMELSPKYALPIGKYPFTINDELEKIDNNFPSILDSLYIDDVQYPRPTLFFEHKGKTDIDFQLGIIDNQYANIEILTLRFYIINGYPTNISYQIILYNSADSIMYQSIQVDISGAELDSEGKVISNVSDTFDASLPDDVVENLSSVTRMSFLYDISTTIDSDVPVRFYTTQEILVHVGAIIETKIQ